MRVPEADAQQLLLPLIEDGGRNGDGSNLPNDDPKPRCFSEGIEPIPSRFLSRYRSVPEIRKWTG
jgi:hypothetical protein